jgi:hypothetical protein
MVFSFLLYMVTVLSPANFKQGAVKIAPQIRLVGIGKQGQFFLYRHISDSSLLLPVHGAASLRYSG